MLTVRRVLAGIALVTVVAAALSLVPVIPAVMVAVAGVAIAELI